MNPINVTFLTQGLGGVIPTADGIAGMVLSAGSAPSGLALNTPARITSLAAAQALGITEAFDTASLSNAWSQIRDFYSEAPNGSPLWVSIVINTTTLQAAIATGSPSPALRLVQAAQLANEPIRVLAIARRPAAGYAPTVTQGIDPDVMLAFSALGTFGAAREAEGQPIPVLLLDGRGMTDSAAMPNLTTFTNRYCSIVVWPRTGSTINDAESFVGMLAGRFAKIPVQRMPGRVKDGRFARLDSRANYSDAVAVVLAGKGYITAFSYPDKAGYYASPAVAGVPTTNDFYLAPRARILTKVGALARAVLIEETQENLPTDPTTGTLSAAYIGEVQARVNAVLNTQIVAPGAATAAVCTLPASQRPVVENKLVATIQIVIDGYALSFDVSIGLAAAL